MKNDCNSCCNKRCLVGPRGLEGAKGPKGDRGPRGYSGLENTSYQQFNVVFNATSGLNSLVPISMSTNFGTNDLITLAADNVTINLKQGYIYEVNYVLICCAFSNNDPYIALPSYIQVFPSVNAINRPLYSSIAYGAILTTNTTASQYVFNGDSTCSASFITDGASSSNGTLSFSATVAADPASTVTKLNLNGTISIYPIAKL